MSDRSTSTPRASATDPTSRVPWTARPRRSRALVLVVVGLLVVYSAFVARGAVAFSERRSAHEIFPFFVWELFSSVPAPVQHENTIRLTAMDGTPLAAPVPYEETTLPMHDVSAARNVMNLIAGAAVRGDHEDLRKYRTIWETRYLHPLTSATYQVVRIEYDVAERYECDCYRAEVVVAEFTMGQP